MVTSSHSYKSIFISDTHLGSRGAQAHHLNNFLKEFNCENLFLVGDIIDEHDVEEDQLWVEERPGIYLVQARLSLEDFTEQTGIDLRVLEAEDEYDTFGGLVFSITNRIPIRGEVIRDTFDNEYSVVDADPRRIKRLRVQLKSQKGKKNNFKTN